MPTPEDVRSKDKFLVQSLPIRAEDTNDLAAVWAGDAGSRASEIKLKVFFQSPQERAASAGAETPRASGHGAAGSPAEAAAYPVTARGERSDPGPRASIPASTASVSAPARAAPAPAAAAAPLPLSSSSASAASYSAADDELRKRLGVLEKTLAMVTSDRDQLHDALSQATSKLEEVTLARKRLEDEKANSAAVQARPPSPDHSKAKGGVSMGFLILVCLIFLLFGAYIGHAYFPPTIAGKREL
jgi:hypothetical protein